MTSAPQVGETFTFAGNATVYTVNAASATLNSNEYSITVNAAKSTANDVALTFLTSRTWSALNSAPDMRGLTAHGTSGSTEGATNINYYGSGVVNSSGVVVFDSPTAAIDIGLNYVIEITTMPADGLIGSSSSASPLTAYPRKIAKAIFNLSNSYNIKVNEMDVLINEISDLDTSAGLTSFTGQKEVHFLGYDTNPTMDITQSVPLPIRILTITTEIYY